jgi:2,4-dienoyl-CoA reductase-like NADH-dependent reductase (Old Yellow Enzyme family)
MTQPLLFTPIKLAGLTARNRIVVSPMCQYASDEGGPNDWHLVHLGKFALGGAAVVFCEETAVEQRARKTYGCAGIYSDKHVPMYRRITEFIGKHHSIPAMQIGHSGRKASCGAPWTNFKPLTGEDAKNGHAPWRGISPSAVPHRDDAAVPHELSVADIKEVIASWREAALRTLNAGFEMIEIHGAHGYLIHQFLSPLANQRTDAYGGDLQGRMRFALELTEAVRAVWPKDKPLWFRVSAVDGDNGAWDIDDTVALVRELKARGVDTVSCSSGGINGPLNMAIVPRTPGYQVPYAERVRRDTGITTCAVGLITEAEHAETILQRGQADLIAMARELMYNPNWPVHAARQLGVTDYLDLLPTEYAWWLKRREKIREISK